jgi:hypothetical protein
MKFDTGVLYKRFSSKREFREKQFLENHTLLKGVNECCSLNMSADFGEIRYIKHIILFSNSKFRENGLSENLTFPKGVYEFPSAIFTLIFLFW